MKLYSISLVALKKSETAESNSQVGFVRMRLLITGNLKNIQSFNDFIPSLPIKSSENSSLRLPHGNILFLI